MGKERLPACMDWLGYTCRLGGGLTYSAGQTRTSVYEGPQAGLAVVVADPCMVPASPEAGRGGRRRVEGWWRMCTRFCYSGRAH